ncbi:MAG TPA: glycosyl transferase, partial [Ruminococcaceae bacterium]|nr:glycosyl transferase [Oscillospiraceae bacterium]
MKVLQINAVYNLSSTGRTTAELHHALLREGVGSYVAYSKTDKPDDVNLYHIGSPFDVKMHGLLSRITGEQAHFSFFSTKKLIKYIVKIQPDVVHLRNLHGNFINLPMLLKHLAEKKVAV